ncbi:KCNA1 [Symbiodinium microadriaticum]|nr:KCNA1 [Symbiodinium microadriaticum]
MRASSSESLGPAGLVTDNSSPKLVTDISSPKLSPGVDLRKSTNPANTGDKAENARKVLEARRQKQRNEETKVTPSAPVPPAPTSAAEETSQGFSQMLGNRILQGVHDILSIMDDKVENLVAEVAAMRKDMRGLEPTQGVLQGVQWLDDRIEGKLDAIIHQLRSGKLERADDMGPAATSFRVGEDAVLQGQTGPAVPKSRFAQFIHTINTRPSELAADEVDPDLHDARAQTSLQFSSGRASEAATEDLDHVPRVPESTAAAWLTSEQNSAHNSARPSWRVNEAYEDEAGPEEGSRQLVLRRLGIGTNEEGPGDGEDNQATSAEPVASHVSAASVVERSPVKKTTASSGIFFMKQPSKRVSTGTAEGQKVAPSVRQRKRTKLQKQVWMFLEDPDLIRGGRIYENVLSCVILASAWLPVIPKQFLGVNDTTVFGLDLALFSVDCLFFLEVTLRFYGCPNRLRFFTSFYNALDILSVILPMAMKLRVQSLSLAAEDNLDMSGIELLLIVLVPVVRLLKLLRRFENSHLIQQAFSEALGALPSLLYCMMLLVFFFSSVIYVLESESGNIESMPRAIWFTMVTLSTVGYGDIVPKSSGGNMVVCVLIVVSAMYMAMPIGIVGKAFGSVWDDRHRLLLMQRLRTRFATVGYDPQDIPGLFCNYDENGDGELSMDEFRRMLQQLEVEAKDERAHDVFQAFDNDGSGAIDDSEFIKTLFPTAYKAIYAREQQPQEEKGED